MLGKDFYFQLIRKYVVTFGKIFDNINITRVDEDSNAVAVIKVPLAYAAKDKLLARVNQDPNIDRASAVTLPRMSFELVGYYYDQDRKLNTIGKLVVPSEGPNTMKYVFNPVPYNFNFKLYVYVLNAEDGTKVIEQILPYFTPEYTPTVHLIPEMEVVLDIPIVLNTTINVSDTYDGAFTQRRAMITALDFTLKGWLFGPIREKAIIKFVKTQFYADLGGLSDPTDTITIQPGLTAEGEPTSKLEDSVDVNTIWATDDYGFIKTIGPEL